MSSTIVLAAALAVKVLVQSTEPAGPAGTGILTETPAGVRVIVKFPIRTALSAPEAIYKGNCTSPGAGKPRYTLHPLSNGMSETSIRGVKLKTLLSGGYTIVVNVTPPLCGDLRTAAPLRHAM